MHHPVARPRRHLPGRSALMLERERRGMPIRELVVGSSLELTFAAVLCRAPARIRDAFGPKIIVPPAPLGV